jgi:hypothetical protein
LKKVESEKELNSIIYILFIKIIFRKEIDFFFNNLSQKGKVSFPLLGTEE